MKMNNDTPNGEELDQRNTDLENNMKEGKHEEQEQAPKDSYVPYIKEKVSEVAPTTSQENKHPAENQEANALENNSVPRGAVTHEPGKEGIQTNELTEEMKQWLTDNQEDYEFYLLHAILHDLSIRNQMMGLPLNPEVFAREEYALVIGAMRNATKIMDIIGGEVAYPPSPEFMRTYINSAAREEASDEEAIEEAMNLLNELQNPRYIEEHYCAKLYFAAWYVAQRAKKKARMLQMETIPDVSSVVDSIQQDLHITSQMDGFMDSRKFDFKSAPERIEPFMKFMGYAVCTPGNISNIQGPPKSAKSAVVSAILASTLSQPWIPKQTDSLEFEAKLPPGQVVLHLDTEQSQFDHDRQIRRSYERAHVKKESPLLHSYRLTGLDPLFCWSKMQEAIYAAKQNHHGIGLIIIDGIADFCRDPNDATESFELIRKLHALASDLDCVIITVLHQNPGATGKTRGHLGSQIERKAETSLRVEKASDVFKIWAENGRSCYIPKSEAWMFHWCDEKKMHVSLPLSDDRWETKKSGNKKPDKCTRYTDEVKRAFGGNKILSYSELHSEISRVVRLAESTAKSRIPEYRDLELIKQLEDKKYQILVS